MADMLFGQEHVERYQATDGAVGHEWQGTTVLLLTTTGRRTGKPYTTPLIYQKDDGGNPIVVASRGGSPKHPDWYENLVANPEVRVQIHGEKFTARARTAGPDEKPALWKKMAATWPAFDEYQTKTNREIPVVILERV